MTSPDDLLVYVGTRAGADDYIHCLALDSSARLRPQAPAEPAANPSFILCHPGGDWLYAVDESGRGPDESGAISTYTVEPGGRLRFLNSQPSGGGAPCHLSLSPDGRHIFVANYWGGSFAAYAIEPDGRLGARTGRVQHEGGSNAPGGDAGPHVHWTRLDPTGRRLLVNDLGRDEVLAYPFEAAHQYPFATPPARYRFAPGSGPRHGVFLAGGRRLAVITEFASTVTLFDYDAEAGTLRDLRSASTLPSGWEGENSAAEIVASPDGRFLYAANRGHDSIAVFGLGEHGDTLDFRGAVPTGGHWPRHFAIDPSGHILIVANQRSHDLRVFRRDSAGGMIEPGGEVYPIPAPTCIALRARP